MLEERQQQHLQKLFQENRLKENFMTEEIVVHSLGDDRNSVSSMY